MPNPFWFFGIVLLSGCTPALFMGPKHVCLSDIHAAAAGGDADQLEILLNKGRNPNSRACGFEPPIFWAARAMKPKAIHVLAARGADVNARVHTAPLNRRQRNETPLMVACNTARYSNHGLSVDATGHREAMIALIDAGADVNALDGSDSVASTCWDSESLSILALRGANLNAPPDRVFLLAIGYSIAAADEAWNLGARADLNVVAMHYLRYHIGRPERSQGALSPNASGWGVPVVEILDSLERRGFSPREAQRQGHRPMHQVLPQQGISLLHWLLSHGADPNERDQVGDTPLAALQRYSTDVEAKATLLVAHGGVVSSERSPR
jgi:hypothetical protein